MGVQERVTGAATGCELLDRDRPILVTEQYPQGLGPTEPELAAALGEGSRPIERSAMSILGAPDFAAALEEAGRDQVVLCGVEAHVCVLQSAADLRRTGRTVHLAADCVSSRRASDAAIALRRMEQMGCLMSSHEMAVLELLRVSGTPAFKEWIRIIR